MRQRGLQKRWVGHQVWKDAPVRVRTPAKGEQQWREGSDSNDEDDTDAREAHKIGIGCSPSALPTRMLRAAHVSTVPGVSCDSAAAAAPVEQGSKCVQQQAVSIRYTCFFKNPFFVKKN